MSIASTHDLEVLMQHSATNARELELMAAAESTADLTHLASGPQPICCSRVANKKPLTWWSELGVGSCTGFQATPSIDLCPTNSGSHRQNTSNDIDQNDEQKLNYMNPNLHPVCTRQRPLDH